MAGKDTSIPKSFGLLLFPQFEVLDAAGPIEVLNALHRSGDQEISLSVIAQTKDLVSPAPKETSNNSQSFLGSQLYKPTHSFEDAPPLDVLIVPGGHGTRETDEELEQLLKFIRNSYNGTDGRPPLQYIFSICTGSYLLARAGILEGERATTNKRAWPTVTPSGKKTHWIAKARWVESGRVWTSSGVTAGIDGMASLVDKIYGNEMGQKLCDYIEHRRTKDSSDDPFAEMNGCEDVPPQS